MAERRGRTAVETSDPQGVGAAIRSGGPGAYLLVGENGLDQEEVMRQVVAHFTADETRTFNCDVFRADERECSAEAISGAVSAYPMLADVRVVVVRNLSEAREEIGAECARLATADLPTTVLLMLAEKLDERKSWVKALRKASTAFPFAVPRGRAFTAWMHRRAKEQGVAMSEPAAALLVEHVGSDLYRAAGEIEKLALHAHPKTRLDVEDVEAVVGITREDTVYQLTDCIAESNPTKALIIARRMVGADQHPAYLVGMIVRHWQALRVTADALRRRREKELGELLGENRPFILNKYKAQARALRLSRIRTGFRLALAAESALKGGWSAPDVILEALICQLSSTTKA